MIFVSCLNNDVFKRQLDIQQEQEQEQENYKDKNKNNCIVEKLIEIWYYINLSVLH